MTDDRTPPASAQALLPTPDQEDRALDAHGFDLAEFDWYPVLRRPRADGWTPAKQRLFIETLADTASPKQAAEAAGMTRSSAYKLRRSPGGEGFAAAWDAAVHQAAKRLVDIALERAVDGVDEPVFNADGQRIGAKTRYNDRLLMFLIRAHLPDRYRHAHEDRRAPDEPLAPDLPPVADAVARLEPPAPPEPAKLVPPDELESRLQVAEIKGGELPGWHDPRPRDALEIPDRHEAAVDRMLEEVRRSNAPHWNPEAIERDAREAEEEERLRRFERRHRRRR